LVAVVKKIIRLKPEFVVFSGGEPFLRKNILFKLIGLVNKNGILAGVNTNGTLIDKDTADKIPKAGISRIAINIESASPEKHNSIRGADSFEKSLRGLKLLSNKLKKDVLAVSTVITKKNYGEIYKIAKLAEKLGVSEYQLIDFIPNKNNESLMLSQNEWKEFYRDYLKIKKDVNIRIIPNHAIMFLEKQNRDQMPFCMAGRFKLLISANGDILPCNFLRERKFYCGNALKDDPGKIWRNSKILRFFREFRPKSKKCASCGHLNKCMGGCRALAYYVSNDISGIDPYCKQT